VQTETDPSERPAFPTPYAINSASDNVDKNSWAVAVHDGKIRKQDEDGNCVVNEMGGWIGRLFGTEVVICRHDLMYIYSNDSS
jgi:hypothetical protein